MYLGLNCNQNTFSATVLDPKSGEVVYFDVVDFDKDLPHRETREGIIQGDNPGEYGIDPQVLVESLELLLENLLDFTEIEIADITHITGSASASTIFVEKSFTEIISKLNPSIPAIEQIRPTYASRFSPSLLDTSAGNYALSIKKHFLDNHGLDTRSVTGCNLSSATGAAQIHKFQRESEEEWQNTTHIHTSSSFLLSVLIGRNAPVDLTDTSHFCLFNIHENTWQENLVDEVSPEALEKLPRVATPGAFVKDISEFFCAKYGFSSKTKCLSWMSPEAAHAIGLNLLNPGDANLDLSDCYTFSLVTKKIPKTVPTLAKVTYHPISGYLTHMVLENGLKSFIATLERLEIDQEDIDSNLLTIPTSNQHQPSLPFVEKEKALLIPAAKQLDSSLLSFTRGQILHIKLYSQWIEQQPTRIYVTGKGAVIKSLRQIISNIFQVDCIHIDDANAFMKGQAIHCDIEQDLSKKQIFDRYSSAVIKAKDSPEPYMANIYSNHLSHYHQLLYKHINRKTTIF